MNREQKAAVIEQIAADITASQAVFAVDYRGITVAQADALRARLRDCDATFRVVKNSLTERAADQAGVAELRPLLEGPTALTFVRGDAAAAAKAISDFARTTQLLAFKGGLMDGAALSGSEVGQIARLPSRDVLYGQLVGLIASPIAGLARTLSALIGGLAVGLGGVLEQKAADPAFAGSPPDREPDAADAGPADSGGEPEAADAAPADDEGEAGGEPAAADAAPAHEAEAAAEPAVEGEAEAEPAVEAEAEAEPAAEVAAEPAVEAEAESEPEAEVAAEPEAEVAAESEAEAADEPEAEAAAGSDELDGAGEPASETDQSKEN
jgi:large subunit ribosomal protein L10